MSLIYERIRKRRAKRIKKIITSEQSFRAQRSESASKPIESAVFARSIKSADADEKKQRNSKWDDPEYAWKMAGNRAWQSADSGVSDAPRKQPAFKKLQVATIVSVCLFTLVWALFQLSTPWAVKGQQWVEEVMTNELNYVKVAQWYDQLFAGSPSFLPSFFNKDEEYPSKPAQKLNEKRFVPASGEIVAEFGTTSSPGIWLKSGALEPVNALSAGWIIYAAESDNQGYTVIIQHANGMQSVYANLANVKLRTNDWVEGGEQIGRFGLHREQGNYQFFFAVRKDEHYLDPQDVVSFD